MCGSVMSGDSVGHLACTMPCISIWQDKQTDSQPFSAEVSIIACGDRNWNENVNSVTILKWSSIVDKVHFGYKIS